MIHIKDFKNGLPLFEALSSPVRLKIIELLLENPKMNLDDIAKALKFTNGGITKHIKKLEEGGLITIKLHSGNRGTQKICTLSDEKILIDINLPKENEKKYEIEFEVGQFVEYEINPTCGFATTERLTCELDNSKNFSMPERFNSQIVWFTDGYLEYRFPNPVKINEKIREIQISFEIAGEAPGLVADYPTDTRFYLNGVQVADYILPGEYTDRNGRLTPSWWYENFGQYGRLRILTINDEGSFLDGLRSSSIKLSDFNITSSTEFAFRIAAKTSKHYMGGVTLFGNGFGDYNQGIKFVVTAQ